MNAQEYEDAVGVPLTDGHVGFQEPKVFPVRPADMPHKWPSRQVEATHSLVETGAQEEILPKYYPAGHEPYEPLQPEERDAGIRGLGLARAASKHARERRNEEGQ